MILCLLLAIVLLYSQMLQSRIKSTEDLRRELQAALELNKQLEQLNRRLESASPIIIDESSGKFKFESGSAELSSQFKSHIASNVVPQIEEIIKQKQGAIDFVQVIGHTDGEGINNNSNLDRILETVAQGKESVSKLSAGSNADLGLMRALAVVRELKKTGLQNVDFRAYSAAQLYLPDGNLASVDRQSDETRRRIEIRFIPPGKINRGE